MKNEENKIYWYVGIHDKSLEPWEEQGYYLDPDMFPDPDVCYNTTDPQVVVNEYIRANEEGMEFFNKEIPEELREIETFQRINESARAGHWYVSQTHADDDSHYCIMICVK